VTVVAEGVEELSDLRALDDFSRQWAQGFHLSRPLDAEAMLRLLDARSSEVARATRDRVVRLPLTSRAS
jgi:EAL domain-containing protein (putative c-di-GMP-specific phosphodiesterase class I)